MTDRLSPGKRWGLARLADASGRFAMLAVDQRPPIADLIARARGRPATFTEMGEVKRLLVESLGRHASAILLDPNYAYPAAIDAMPHGRGLIVTLEDHRFDDGPGGRRSHAIADWSVEAIRRIGADAVKVLAWYRPDASAEVRSHQQAFVAAIGERCRALDIAFVFELLVYPFAGRTDYVEDPDKRPDLVIDSVREFVQPRYGVDLLKLESPVPAAALPPHGTPAASEAQRAFDALGALARDAGLPWVMLSAGATAGQFANVLDYAFAAGAHGYLAGRAIWAGPLARWPDAAARVALGCDGGATMRALNAKVAAGAARWTPGSPLRDRFATEGEFAREYGPRSPPAE